MIGLKTCFEKSLRPCGWMKVAAALEGIILVLEVEGTLLVRTPDQCFFLSCVCALVTTSQLLVLFSLLTR